MPPSRTSRTLRASSAGEYGWGGAQSTHFWVDHREELLGVFMVQLVPADFRPARIFQLLAYQALVGRPPFVGPTSVDILVQHTNVKDRPIYDRMGLPGLDPDVLVNLDALRLMQDWWVERGLQTEKVDLDRAVDDSFARAAAAELGPARR